MLLCCKISRGRSPAKASLLLHLLLFFLRKYNLVDLPPLHFVFSILYLFIYLHCLPKIMAASTKIPPVAQPFVSDRAKKTLDLVCSRPNRPSRIVHSDIMPCRPAPSSLLTTSLFFRGNRSRNLSRKIVFPPTPSSPPSSARARSDGRLPPS